MADAITQFYNKLSTAGAEQQQGPVSIWQANGKANPEYFLPNLKKKPDSGISHSEGSHSEHSDNEQKKQLNANNKRELSALEKLQLHGGKKQCIEQVADDSSEENINVDVVGSSEESDIDGPHHRLLNNLSNQESHESSSSSHSASGTLVLANGTQLLLPTSTARQRLFAQAEKQRRRQRRRESIRTKLDELMKQVRYLQREYSKTNENENTTSSTESDSCDEHAVGLLQSIALPTSSPLLEKLIKRELNGVVSKIVEQVKGQGIDGNTTTQHSCGEDSNGQSSSIETNSAPKTPSPTPPQQSPTPPQQSTPVQISSPTQLLPPANPIKQIPQIQKISPLPAAAIAAAQRHTSLQTTPSRNLSKEMGTSSTAAFRPLLSNHHQRTTSLTVAPTSNTVAPPSQTSPNNAYTAYLQAAQKIQQQQQAASAVQQTNAQQLAALQQQTQQQAALAQAQQNAVAQQHAAAQQAAQQGAQQSNVAAAAYQQAYQKALLAAKINQSNQEAMINQTLAARQQQSQMLGASPLTKLPFGYGDMMGDGFGTFDPMDPHGFNAYHKEGLTPHHLKKAKLMFFYTRYPSSSILKTYFTDVRFNRATTSQLIKWFSNFREFFYIHIEKIARQAVQDGAEKPEALTLTRDAELIRVLNNHYNKSNQFEVPNEFIRVAEQAMREFFQAIRDGKDQDPSWKKVIYKIICKLDAEIPAKFKAPQLAELGD